ncbi:MAG: LuxR family transcriptional regulator, maltose regulon positive regulatory protein [Trebonia sp.]|nr:LuxR family transcriptional regulator, maltose regulon positive regulatory protein [Trebonia sp.]
MEPAALSGAAGTPAAPAVRDGVVSRPGLFQRLTQAQRVVQVSAPAGSGKTVLLRSWIAESGLAKRAAWVSVPGERDPQRFWISVAGALRDTVAGSALVRGLTVAPELDGWTLVERLLEDLAALDDRIWLVIDDLHELHSAEALRQLELLIMRAPAALRFVLITRHDLRLGLHRLRLAGELTEIRTADLRFTLPEGRALLDAAGVPVPDSTLALLYDRTEGWAAGLRLAALSLAGHPDPERFAAEFGGSERTVAEYLLAEVLERQTEEARRLLLRTSILERVNGELADLLTGGSGGERVLQELEEAGAFVVSLDARRSWFRYHRLFADLLQLELRGSAPAELPALHDAAAGWYAEHGYPVEAVRHAQAAGNWVLAARVLSDQWIGLGLAGLAGTAHELLARFPAGVIAADAELAARVAGDQLARGSLEEAERYLAISTRAVESVPAGRRGRAQVVLAVVRMRLARQRGDLAAVAEEARRLLAPAVATDLAEPRLGEDLRALALINLGIAELWTSRFDEADRHLEDGVALARQIGRPYLEVTGLAHWAQLVSWWSFPLGTQRSLQAIELADEHGWADEPVTGLAYLALGVEMVVQGRLEEAGRALDRAERTVRTEVEPAAGVRLHYGRGMLEFVSGRHDAALRAFQRAERLARSLVTPHTLSRRLRSHLLQTLTRRGETGRVEQALANMDRPERERGEMRIAEASLRLAQDNPSAATAVLAPVIDGSAPLQNAHLWDVQAFLLQAIACDALGDAGAARRALERALDRAAPESLLFPFLYDPAPELLDRHRRHGTAHAGLIAEILNVLAGSEPGSHPSGPQRLREPLSHAEARVLRYLPTKLSVPEIADELYLSVNTVKTHMRHLYDKLGAHRRHEAVEQARALGLLAPPPRRP